MSVVSSCEEARDPAPRRPWNPLRNWLIGRRRRRVTLDLLNASPHLLRDIGAETILGDHCPR